MQALEDRIMNCIRQSRIKCSIDFGHFNTNPNYEYSNKLYKCYRYPVSFYAQEFLDRYDRWSSGKLNDKIERVNEIFKKQIHFCIVHLNPASPIKNEMNTELVILFEKS